MNKHEEKKCPKCGGDFICKAGDIHKCQCKEVLISEETHKFLSSTYFDCLCKNCLQEINQKLNLLRGYQFPTQKEMLIEGLHFYKEDGKWVFTEVYHMLRGYCCNSGCRHCAYGFKK